LRLRKPFHEVYGDSDIDGGKADDSGESVSRGGPQRAEQPRSQQQSLPVPPPSERRTPRGGTAHTFLSRSKISKANRGKTPWNKGMVITEERREKIRQGVIQSLLKKKGWTEEEYLERKKKGVRGDGTGKSTGSKRRKKLSEDKKKHLSEVMKKKWADEGYRSKMKTRPKREPVNEETKKKISETLKKKWEDDSFRKEQGEKRKKYWEQMNDEELTERNQRISDTLKEKWKDPIFRSKMEVSSKLRIGSKISRTTRLKISRSITNKWVDKEWRKKVVEGINDSKKRAKEQGETMFTNERKENLSEAMKKSWRKSRRQSTRAWLETDDDIKTAKVIKAEPKVAVQKKKEPKKKARPQATTIAASTSATTSEYVKIKDGLKAKKTNGKAKNSSSSPKNLSSQTSEHAERKERVRFSSPALYDALYSDEDDEEDDDDEDDEGVLDGYGRIVAMAEINGLIDEDDDDDDADDADDDDDEPYQQLFANVKTKKHQKYLE